MRDQNHARVNSYSTADVPIQVDGLRKTYRDGLLGRRRVEALRGVSLEVHRGQIFGLLGPNGAGKTTLIKVLLGIVRKSGGQARLLGRPPGDRDGRRRVGYLPENHRIPRHHTGNTALEYYGSLSGVPVGEIKRRRSGLLAQVGLADWGKVSVKKYSKGMLQRLGMAQALLHEPELLILDEPTDGVDPVGRSEMRALLQKLSLEGTTIFINSHLLQEIELVCDRVAILVKGEVRRQGLIEDLTDMPQTVLNLVLSGPAVDIAAVLPVGACAKRVNGSLEHQVSVPVKDQATADRLIDELRRRGVSIIALAPHRRTLEEVFLETVSQPAGEAPLAAEVVA